MMSEMLEPQDFYMLECERNKSLSYLAPILKFSDDGRRIVYFDCLGEVKLARDIAQQQAPEIRLKLASMQYDVDFDHLVLMYCGNGSTYGQELSTALGLPRALVSWGEIKPKWRTDYLSSDPFRSITDPSGTMTKAISAGWPQLAKLKTHHIRQVIIVDDVMATGSSLLAVETLIPRIAQTIGWQLQVLGFVIAAQEGEVTNSTLTDRLLTTPVFQIPLLDPDKTTTGENVHLKVGN
jgi:hypothetical protein